MASLLKHIIIPLFTQLLLRRPTFLLHPPSQAKTPSMASSRVIYMLSTLSMVLGASGHTANEMAAHSGGSHAAQETPETYPTTYFTLDTQQLAIQAHISLMILSWFIILPIGKSVSI